MINAPPDPPPATDHLKKRPRCGAFRENRENDYFLGSVLVVVFISVEVVIVPVPIVPIVLVPVVSVPVVVIEEVAVVPVS